MNISNAEDTHMSQTRARGAKDKEQMGVFGWGPWTIQDALIPPHVGLGRVTTYYQRRTLCQYLTVSAGGLWIFFNLHNTAYRATGLGLIFPCAGFVAVATIPSIIAAMVSMVFLALSLGAYFVLGAISIPLLVWLGSAISAGILAQDSLYEPSGWLCAILGYGSVVGLMIRSQFSNVERSRKAQERNKWLAQAVQEQLDNASPAPSPGSREVPLETLRHIQFTVERGLTAPGDFSRHDVIEQFQGSALRYQLYSLVDALSLYQCHYVPNFHGYVSQASRNAIDKSLRKEVLSYWKWEALFGHFSFRDWNPYKYDNIMVTGYLAAATGLYGQVTGDKRYQEQDCMEFVVTDKKRYKTNYQGIIDALRDNMTKNRFTLYPCEPNWTFPVCNLVGFSGLVMSDNILGRNQANELRNRFERALEEEFTDRDGSILPFRSELTGLPVRLTSAMFYAIVTMILPAFWPHIGHRSWAIMKKELLTYDDKRHLQVGGGDDMDNGNYRKGPGAVRAFIAAAAGEYGDENIRQEALDQLDGFFPIETTQTGSIFNKDLSAMAQSVALMSRLIRRNDLANAARFGPPASALTGPLLAQAPFPLVLVAKAFSKDGRELELVLYNGREAGSFTLGFERLIPNQKYALSNGDFIVADTAGAASAEVFVRDRTHINLVPISL